MRAGATTANYSVAISGWGDNASTYNLRIYLNRETGPVYSLKLRGTGYSANVKTISADTWYWVTVDCVKNGTCTLRVFGTDASEVSAASSVTATANNNAAQYLRLGNMSAGPDEDVANFFDDLVADWTDSTYPLLGWASTWTVTYNGNSQTAGTAPTDPSSPYTDGATVTVLTNSGTLSRTGYYWSGWNTAANGSGTTYVPGGAFSISANTTLYALWVAQATAYIRDGASGGANGTSWTDAFDDVPTTLVRGTTYWIADGSYTARTIDDAASGSSEIWLRKATTQSHGSETGWSSAFGDGQADFTGTWTISVPFITISGTSRSTESSGYGFLTTTGQAKGVTIGTDSANSITIAYMEILGVGDDGTGSPANDLIYIVPSAGSVSGVILQYLYLKDAGRAHILGRNASNVVVEHCLLSGNESTVDQHAESISAYNNTDAWTVRYNHFLNCEGTGVVVFAGQDWLVYANVLNETETTGGLGNGAICTWSGYTVSGAVVVHNTLSDLTGTHCSIWFDDETGNVAYNNILWDCAAATFFAGVTHDYNASDDDLSEGNDQLLLENPFVGAADFHISRNTYAGKTDLGVAYATDMDGRSRTTWSRGAYEYRSASSGRTVSVAQALGLFGLIQSLFGNALEFFSATLSAIRDWFLGVPVLAFAGGLGGMMGAAYGWRRYRRWRDSNEREE